MIGVQFITTQYHKRDYVCKHHSDLFREENHEMKTLATRLKDRRDELGLTQTELAKRAGLKSQSIIGMLESGEMKNSSHLPAIAKALGVEVLWLQYEDGVMYRYPYDTNEEQIEA